MPHAGSAPTLHVCREEASRVPPTTSHQAIIPPARGCEAIRFTQCGDNRIPVSTRNPSRKWTSLLKKVSLRGDGGGALRPEATFAVLLAGGERRIRNGDDEAQLSETMPISSPLDRDSVPTPVLPGIA